MRARARPSSCIGSSKGSNLPVLGFLRDTQNYVQLAAHGLTMWDVAKSRVEKDLEQWQPIIEWAARK